MEGTTGSSSRRISRNREEESSWTSTSRKGTGMDVADDADSNEPQGDMNRRRKAEEKVQQNEEYIEEDSSGVKWQDAELRNSDEPEEEIVVAAAPKPKPRPRRSLALNPDLEISAEMENISPPSSSGHQPTARHHRGLDESDEIVSAPQIKSVFVNLRDLPKLDKIESINKGQFLTSTFKYEKPLSNFKMRVRLLKYPTLSEKYEWTGDFLVLDDRVFSWQEKVFSKSEIELYSDKKNLISELDEDYNKTISRSPESAGKYLYSFTQSDLTVCMTMPRPTVRRCGAKHSGTIHKTGNNLADHKLVNSDNESVIDEQLELGGDEYGRSVLTRHTFSETLVGAMGCFRNAKRADFRAFSHGNGTYQDEIIQHLRKNLGRDRRLQRQAEETEKATKKRVNLQKAEQEIKEESRKRNQDQKEFEKTKKVKEMERKRKEKEEEYVKKWVGSKRPSLALSAHMRTGAAHLTPSKRLTGKGTTKSLSGNSALLPDDMESGWETDDATYPVGIKPDWKPRRNRRTGRSSVEEILGPRAMESRSFDTSVVNPNSEQQSDDEINIRHPNLPFDTKSGKKATNQIRISSRRMRQVKARESQDQSMFIMVSLPHMPRHKRDVTVCAVKTLPRAGVVQLKPAFGYRNIEAKRNHVYRLSWELFSPSSENEDGESETDTKDYRKESVHTEEANTDKTSEGSALDDIGETFETIPRNEVRLVFMGEILSTHGFSHGPICVHYLIDLPKGWRNDSVLSSLQGITHRSDMHWSGVAHFSQDFFGQLAFSTDSVEENEAFSRPMMLLMVMATDGRRVRNEGYAYVPIPSRPGHHVITVPTWKLAPRSIKEKLMDVFLNIAPSLQDIKAVHVPTCDSEECRRPNRLGLETEPSGSVKLRFHVIHQIHSMDFRQNEKIDLIEKMSSATILRSVQTVIEAFQRAQRKAAAANH